MEHESVTWGGRVGRYARNPGEAIRIYDPIERIPLEFGHDLVYEAWLIKRFDPSVKTIQVGRQSLANLAPSTAEARCVQLDVQFQDGRRSLLSISVHGIKPARVALLRRLAARSSATPVILDRDGVRENKVLLQNLRRLRKEMVLYPKAIDSPMLKQAIMAVASIELPTLRHQLAGCTSGFIDSGLGFLFQSGMIDMNLSEVQYGPKTIVRWK